MRKIGVTVLFAAAFVTVFGAGLIAGNSNSFELWPRANAQKPGRVFELRTYTASGGRMEELKTRFRDHTMRYFENTA